MSRPPRPFVLLEANYRQLLDHRPQVAVLPWGATEAHNYHLPAGTDVIQAGALAEACSRFGLATGRETDRVATDPVWQQRAAVGSSCHHSFLHDNGAGHSARRRAEPDEQGIDRLVILNAHGGNEFKPLVRDVQLEYDVTIVVVNFWTGGTGGARGNVCGAG